MKKMNKISKKGGFTLIEILVVIGIIAVLAAIVIVAINPAKQFAQARNTQRTSNVESILNAIGQRIADNKGVFAGEFKIAGEDFVCPILPDGSTGEAIINDDNAEADEESGILGGCLVPTYISALPYDPIADSTDEDTEYTVRVLDNGRVEVCAPNMTEEEALPEIEDADACLTR